MNGEWVPTGWLAMSPWWLNLFENAVTIQCVHRMFALVVIGTLVALWWRSRSEDYACGSNWMLLALTLQVALGISALLMKVPVSLGAAHQGGAVVLLASVLWVAHRARFSPQPSS